MTSSKSTPIQLPLPIEESTFEIPLTKGYATIIDAVDADLAAWRWHTQITEVEGLVYAVRTMSDNTWKDTYQIWMHRVILARKLGYELSPEQKVDHINGNGVNNLRSNLRLATQGQNARNNRISTRNTSGVLGVYWRKENNCWAAKIRFNYRLIHLGYFANFDDAVAARLAAEQKHFGEFAPSLSRQP